MLHYHLFEFDPAFDLKTGRLPDSLHLFFGDQLTRARALLADRTPAQIDFLIDSLDWILRESGSKEFEKALATTEQAGECFISRVKALKLRREEFDISGQPSLPDASWIDYFAVLTLAYVSEYLYESNATPQTSGPQHSGDYSSNMIDWALEAMDAVGYAEHLNALALRENQLKARTNLDLETAVQNELQARGRKGGRKRAEPFDTLREKVFQLYVTKYQKRSAREAARLIYQELKSEVDEILKTDDPEKRLEKWIGQHRLRLHQ